MHSWCGNVPEHVFYLTLLNTNPLGKELLLPARLSFGARTRTFPEAWVGGSVGGDADGDGDGA